MKNINYKYRINTCIKIYNNVNLYCCIAFKRTISPIGIYYSKRINLLHVTTTRAVVGVTDGVRKKKTHVNEIKTHKR